MKKILINRNRIAVMQFEKKVNQEQELFNEAVQILNKTGLLIDDPEVQTKLALHYTKDLNFKAPMNKLIGLTEFETDFYRFKNIMDSLSFELDVYTTDGKELHIESMYSYLEDPEEIEFYHKLKDIAEKLEALEISRGDIRGILKPYVFGWNPYDQSELELTPTYFRDGIESCKKRKASRISIAEQKKDREAKQMA